MIETEKIGKPMVHIEGVPDNMIANNLEPFEPVHPGELLKDEIEFRGISRKALAESMGIKPTIVSDIINGKRRVNTEYAFLIEAALNVPAEMFINLQKAYDIQVTRRNPTFMEKLRNVRRIAAVL